LPGDLPPCPPPHRGDAAGGPGDAARGRLPERRERHRAADGAVGALTTAHMKESERRPEAADLLRQLAGPDADFRQHQLEAVEDLVVGRRRVLCVQRTGWGKSAVYFIATALLRRAGEGPTLLISPLLALMRNQIEAAERLGLRAATVNSTNRDDLGAVRARLAAD